MDKERNIDDVFGNDDREIIKPVYRIKEGESGKIKPVYKLDELQNTPERFVILKTTDNGKYLVRNSLLYKFRGIDIITDSDNAIFIDTINNTVLVREYSRALRSINPEDPEKRQYVFLLYDPYDSDDPPIWQSVVGRTSAYQWIKTNVGTFDPASSLVLTENVCLKDALTISQFVKHLRNADIRLEDGSLIKDDGFNIEEYEFEEN